MTQEDKDLLRKQFLSIKSFHKEKLSYAKLFQWSREKTEYHRGVIRGIDACLTELGRI